MKRLACIFVLATACQPSNAGPPAPEKGAKAAPTVEAIRVETAEVRPVTVELHLQRPGEVEGSREAELATPLGGLVESVHVDEGQLVKKGATIALIDARALKAQLRLAEIEVDEAARELKRLERMGSAVAGARRDAAATRLARAEANADLARINASHARIKAPFAGYIADLNVEVGEVAAPGIPVARLVQLDEVTVSVSVADRDVSGLRAGGEAYVIVAGQPAPTLGTIARINPAADLRTRSFVVEVNVKNSDLKLKPGMIASVDFRQSVVSDKIVLPQSILITGLEKTGVFVAENGAATFRELALGPLVRDQVVIEEGLAPGDAVVVLGQRSLAEGDPLIVHRNGRCCTDGRITFSTEAAATSEHGVQGREEDKGQ